MLSRLYVKAIITKHFLTDLERAEKLKLRHKVQQVMT